MPPRPDIWKVTLSCAPALADVFEQALLDGSLSVTCMIPPRCPLARIEVLFPSQPDVRSLCAKVALLAAIHKTKAPRLDVTEVGDLDWLKKIAADFPPLDIGRWTVYGAAHRAAIKPYRLNLRIDATNAFGTGEHPTTRGCLLALEKALKTERPRNMLDIGCGSGILAMAFAQRRRAQTVAVDLDPEAVTIAQENVSANGFRAFVTVGRGRGCSSGLVRAQAPYDLIVANIFARPLCLIAGDVKRSLESGGLVILSGILNTQENAVLSAYRRQGLFLQSSLRLGEWSILMLRSRART